MAAVRAAAQKAVQERFLLPEDADRLIEQAEAQQGAAPSAQSIALIRGRSTIDQNL